MLLSNEWPLIEDYIQSFLCCVHLLCARSFSCKGEFKNAISVFEMKMLPGIQPVLPHDSMLQVKTGFRGLSEKFACHYCWCCLPAIINILIEDADKHPKNLEVENQQTNVADENIEAGHSCAGARK